jgi:hypothetical protein
MLGNKRKVVDTYFAVFLGNYLVELDAASTGREIMFLLAGDLAGVASGAIFIFD